jgi:3-oxoacyl-[acyl-carrier-protein] synthase II
MSRRVVITGLGLICPTGNSVRETWENIVNGKSGIDHITHFNTDDFKVKIAGEVKNLDVTKFGITQKDASRMDEFERYALCAAAEAMEDAGFIPDIAYSDTCDFLGFYEPRRVTTLIGVGFGGIRTVEEGVKILYEKGPSKVPPFFVPISIANMAAGYISMRFGAKGPCLCTTTACAAGLHAIGQAAHLIKYGISDIAIAGGSEATITPIGIASFASMRALSTRNDQPQKASRPFDKDRDGFVIGEGAGILILEEYDSAKKRGAKIYAEVLGFGMSADAYHITAPDPEGDGFVLAMENALSDAKIPADSIGYINAHGTSTKYNDPIETKAVKRVFGEHAKNLCISSTKSMTGHLLGAAGAVETIFALLSIFEGSVPPTINLDEPDPECDLDYVPHEAREMRVEYAMCNSFGFGGTNGSLILGRV